MYQPYYRRPRKSARILPFFTLIIIGVISVMAFQIYTYFSEKRAQSLENKAAVQIVAGQSEMKIWGVDQWAASITGAILHEGDSLRTAPGSRVVISLLNGTQVRLNSETEIELTGLKTRDGEDELALALKRGEVWLKRPEKPEIQAKFVVTTNHLEVSSLGTIFNIAQDTRERVQVIDGKVQAIIRVESAPEEVRIAETLEVALGQEISIGQEELNDLQNRRVTQLLALLSDSLRVSEWYAWNRLQDSSSASTAVSVADAVAGSSTYVSSMIPAVIAPEVEVSEALGDPEILTPEEGKRVTKESSVLITGRVSRLTQKIEITTYAGGRPEPYFLLKYKPGSENWSYLAARELGNLMPGANRFTFVAVDAKNKRSNPTEIVLMLDQPQTPIDLSPPQVVSINGGNAYEVEGDVAEINGTIGKGIVKLVVNDFALSRYVPDGGRWIYFAKSVYGNFKDGENIFNVYGIAYDGKRTPVTTFTITKKTTLESVGSSTILQ